VGQTKEKAIAATNGVTRGNYNCIEQGMSLEKVEEILGRGKEELRAGNNVTINWRTSVSTCASSP
jgi:hypothetical protein